VGFRFRGRPKQAHTYATSPYFVGDGMSLGGACAGLQGALLLLVLIWRLELYSEPRKANCGLLQVLLRTATGERAPAPGRTPRETGASAERDRGFDLQPQPKGELAQGGYKGTREVLARPTTQDTAAPPSRGVARGGVKDPTDDPAELDVLF
jgi:hypothetical protein